MVVFFFHFFFSGQQPPLNYPHHTQQPNQSVNAAIQANAPPTAAKWHIPQSAQQLNGGLNNQGVQSALAMQFGNSNGGMSRSYKIALKSPSSLKQTSTQNPNQNIAGAPNVVEVPSTVTSTNPKTPSPSTNDVGSILQFIEMNYEKKIFVFLSFRIPKISVN